MEERKEYSIIGKVEIGTDEYRDLIEEKAEAQKNADDYRSKYWDVQSQKSKADDKIKALSATIENYTNFFETHEEVQKMYKKWMLERTLFNEEEDEE